MSGKYAGKLSEKQTGKLLMAAIPAVVVGAVAASLIPPLILERIVDSLAAGKNIAVSLALSYFLFLALAGVLEAARECLLVVFGQKITHDLRLKMCRKLTRLPAEAFVSQEPGVMVSRFVGDVDALDALFTSGIISMFADGCKIISIFAILFVKNRGLAYVLLILLPFLFLFTRTVQKRMLAAQLKNRAAVGKVSGHVPETIRRIRMIHTFHREGYMREKYDRYIRESYAAVERTNFYDAVYSPVILVLNAAVIAAVMILSSAEDPAARVFFGMSVGTSVAVINYISQVFGPIESIGMEIQTIQSAVAGVRRIREFLKLPERERGTVQAGRMTAGNPDLCVELSDVTFGYETGIPVLENLNVSIEAGEQVTLTGRTGAGKSTVFKLLLGLYRPERGHVLICGTEAAEIADPCKRKLFGYVEQQFSPVPGTVLDQITLSDGAVTREQAVRAAVLVGIDEAIRKLERGYDTPCTPALFSQGQWQLLSIARAVASEPAILLLDEITANLDSETEELVLEALKKAAGNRTVISISHRLYESMGGRKIVIG